MPAGMTPLTLVHLTALHSGITLVLGGSVDIAFTDDHPMIIGVFSQYELGLAIGHTCGAMLVPPEIQNSLRSVVFDLDDDGIVTAVLTQCTVDPFIIRRYMQQQSA